MQARTLAYTRSRCLPWTILLCSSSSRARSGKRNDFMEKIKAASGNKNIELDTLTAISPIDGRYRDLVKGLSAFVSEEALIKTRVEIEAKYLIALSELGPEAGLVRPLSLEEKETLKGIGASMSHSQVERVKEIENEIHHDVKAMVRAFRELLAETTLADVVEMVHFGLTSEDVNNMAYRLMLQRAIKSVCIPAIDKVVDWLREKGEAWSEIPMLGRTHGQDAVPTTVGKELINVAVWIDGQ